MTPALYHKPVLRDEAVRLLVTDPHGTYVDGTLGGGGHAAQILDQLDRDARLFGVDQDEEAIALAKQRFAEDERVTLVRGNFGYLDVLLPKECQGTMDGILLDLGVSSHQIDEARRGFSFQQDGPLDMRMGSLQTRTAADIVNNSDYEVLRDLFFQYGEERESKRIARSVIDARPLETTGQLREAVSRVIPERFRNKSLARIFQALRIEVNGELQMLRRILEKGLQLLRDEGRFVVITYHSLEDRLCKNYFRYGNFEGKPVKDFYGNEINPMEVLRKKVIVPSDSEIAENPRARSAKLRVAFKRPGQERQSPDSAHNKPAGRRGGVS
ncbi:16S rRNA (cytosine(1402)-N(4))-methyltransferase RsmH [Balneolales bacterium ANBcel1]|nr:16S rRNA (cytosine(1402)-N(4))-methyltransferase RsmH [Balneolales bacterium ANBcel1]